jgi:hypothetical protein
MLPRAPYPGLRVVFVAAALTLAFATGAPATMVARMALDGVTREAARIVHATVVDVHSGRDESGLPATWVTLDVVRSLKGPSTRRITVKQYGTAAPLADGTVTRVAGLPGYKVGEELVLFLRGESRLGFTSPVGFGQGKYRVARRGRRTRVRRELPDGGSQDLDEFLGQVGALAGP